MSAVDSTKPCGPLRTRFTCASSRCLPVVPRRGGSERHDVAQRLVGHRRPGAAFEGTDGELAAHRAVGRALEHGVDAAGHQPWVIERAVRQGARFVLADRARCPRRTADVCRSRKRAGMRDGVTEVVVARQAEHCQQSPRPAAVRSIKR